MSRCLLGAGGAHADRRGRVTGAFIPGASNPGVMREEAGGGVFNALRAARLQGAVCRLLSVRGGDAAGAQVEAAAEATGIADFSAVFLGRRTASYTAILSADGDVIAALADMAIYDGQFARSLRRKAARTALAEAAAVLMDANLPVEAIDMVLAAASAPVHAIAVSPAKAVRFSGRLGKLATLFMNRREAAALTGLDAAAPPRDFADALRGLGLQRGVITHGAGPLLLFEGPRIFRIQPPDPGTVSDVTGAGDALAGTACAAMLAGHDFAEAVRRGAAAAALAVTSPDAAANFTNAEFDAMLARTPAAAEEK